MKTLISRTSNTAIAVSYNSGGDWHKLSGAGVAYPEMAYKESCDQVMLDMVRDHNADVIGYEDYLNLRFCRSMEVV